MSISVFHQYERQKILASFKEHSHEVVLFGDDITILREFLSSAHLRARKTKL